MTLTEFLLARIAEDERDGWEIHDQSCDCLRPVPYPCDCGRPARVLAECEAKRRIVMRSTCVADRKRVPTDRPGIYDMVDVVVVNEDAEDTLRILASVYADHPDYQQEWT